MRSNKIVVILLIAIISTFMMLSSAFAGIIGGRIYVTGVGNRFPDAAYNSVNQKHLVAYSSWNYDPIRICGQFVTNAGVLSGDPFTIANIAYNALHPMIAYNSTNNEFLVTWINGADDYVYGRRVRGSDGVLLGSEFLVSSTVQSYHALAWSSGSNCYLSAYWSGGDPEIRAQRISNTGTLLGGQFNISNDADFSSYPSVSYSPSTNQFMVTWEQENAQEVTNIRGRRVDAATGALMGSLIYVTSSSGNVRPVNTYDSVNNRWLVQYQCMSPNVDQYGQLIGTDGSLIDSSFPIANSALFEGDTLFGGDLAFAPGVSKFFSVFAWNTNMGGQELNASGSRIGSELDMSSNVAPNEVFGHSCSVDTDLNRFLAVWEHFDGSSIHVHGRLYEAIVDPPGAVSSFTATPMAGQVNLTWINPSDPQFTGTMIRYKTTGYPTSPGDGALVIDKTGSPNAGEQYTHTGLTNGTTYYYSVYAHDAGSNYAPAALAVATPTNITLINIRTSAFGAGIDGWITSTWRSGSLDYGTIGMNGTAVACNGAGDTDNNDRCNREGGEIRKTISTANRENIFVSYDVKVNILGNNNTGAGAGTCAVDHNLIDEQLTVYYSTNAGSTWNELDSVKRADLVASYQGYATRQIDLSSITACNRNSQFALRFRWQLNTASDIGYLDNIVVQGSLATPVVTDDGVYTGSLNRLHCKWIPGGTGPSQYKYCIGTSPGASDIAAWTNVGNALEVLREDLTLSENQTYYFSVQGGTSTGIWSPTGYSDGITVPVGVGIQEAKGLPDGQAVAIRGVVVSARFTDCRYVQDPDGYFGIKAVTSAFEGETINIAGVMTGADSERSIDCTGNPVTWITTIPAITTIEPVAMNNLAIGGTDLNEFAPGVEGGRGVNNLGSFVRVWGKVTQRDTADNQYFYIDDGSGLKDGTKTAGIDNVGVRIKADPTNYATDSYFILTGVSSCFTDSLNKLRPQILITY